MIDGLSNRACQHFTVLCGKIPQF